MLFMHAVHYLREHNIVVKWTTKVSARGRFYKVHELESDMPPIWMLPKAICSLAELTMVVVGMDVGGDVHGVPV